jgi:flagellin-like hook-associated protein FlgL
MALHSIITNTSAEVALNFRNNISAQLATGFGALVDADGAQESATLQSLRTQQQLATSSLSIAAQTPSLLTKLIQ